VAKTVTPEIESPTALVLPPMQMRSGKVIAVTQELCDGGRILHASRSVLGGLRSQSRRKPVMSTIEHKNRPDVGAVATSNGGWV
jgi:hypothetical protein